MDEKKISASRFFGISNKKFRKLLSVATGVIVLLVVAWGASSGGKNQPAEKYQNVSSQKQTKPINQPDRNPPAGNSSPRPDESKKLAKNPNGKIMMDTKYDDHPLGNLHKPRIVIEKSKLTLTVFDGRRVLKRYRAAVGGGKGDKTREGDHCTPVGVFYVCVRNPKSKYVLSLGLSYPNLEDARRGLQAGLINQIEYDRITYAIGKGRQPPWNTKLGGEIMIHGKRKGGRETQGCIALEDGDIRELFPKIPVGTKVTILP